MAAMAVPNESVLSLRARGRLQAANRKIGVIPGATLERRSRLRCLFGDFQS